MLGFRQKTFINELRLIILNLKTLAFGIEEKMLEKNFDKIKSYFLEKY